jgi:hypothetical protein
MPCTPNGVVAAASTRPARLSTTMPDPSGLPATGWTTTATLSPCGSGYGRSCTGLFRLWPRARSSAPAVASTTAGRPASRSSTLESGLTCIAVTDNVAGAATDTNAPTDWGSPATESAIPSELELPVPSEKAVTGFCAE